jgi:hypothetical protein
MRCRAVCVLCALSTLRLVFGSGLDAAPVNPRNLPMTIKVGERLPNVTVRQVTPDGPKPVETKDYFAGKTVVLFGLPGAFTPTCHKNHLPGFIVGEAAFKSKGVDKIAMTSVNDHYVLGAWSEATGAKGTSIFSPGARAPSPRRSASTSTLPPAAWACARSAMQCWSRTGW